MRVMPEKVGRGGAPARRRVIRAPAARPCATPRVDMGTGGAPAHDAGTDAGTISGYTHGVQ